MNPEYLRRMSGQELDDYARSLGIRLVGKKTVAQKLEAIEADRDRYAEMTVLGVTVRVRKRALRDKRVTDIFENRSRTAEMIDEAMRLIVTDETWEEIYAACTDEDGSVDVDALTYATNAILEGDAVKNLLG